MRARLAGLRAKQGLGWPDGSAGKLQLFARAVSPQPGPATSWQLVEPASTSGCQPASTLKLESRPQEGDGRDGTSSSLLLEAQVEVLKLTVSQLRRQNAELRREAAVAAAERADAARHAALAQLARLQLPGGRGQPSAAPEPLQLAVAERYLRQQRDSYHALLEQQQEQHEGRVEALWEQLHRQQEQHVEQLARAREQSRQAEERHQQEMAVLSEDLRDPSRGAEAQLLREDNAFLKVRVLWTARGLARKQGLMTTRWRA